MLEAPSAPTTNPCRARAPEPERVEHAAREDLDRGGELDRHAPAARRMQENSVRGPRRGAQLRELGPARERARRDAAPAGLLARVRRIVERDPVPAAREPPGAE